MGLRLGLGLGLGLGRVSAPGPPCELESALNARCQARAANARTGGLVICCVRCASDDCASDGCCIVTGPPFALPSTQTFARFRT